MAALVLLSYEQGNTLRSTSLSTITAALQLEKEVDVLLVGDTLNERLDQAIHLNGVRRVLVAKDPSFAHMQAESVANLMASLASDYEFILAAANAEGKNILPRLAGLLDVQPISEVTKIIDKSTFVRPIYAGSLLATVCSKDKKKLLSIRGTAFTPIKTIGGNAEIKEVTLPSPLPENQKSIFLNLKLSQSNRPELEAAKIIISGGRGMQSSDNFTLLEKIADLLNAAIGASRAAVDSGFVSNDFQVGQTGKIVAPELYIAVALSGATQHLAGMKDSKIVVAINKDPDAPIFKASDYGIVGDVFEILPRLEEGLKNRI